MNTKLTIKNFRIFDEDGETFSLKPITILTGCNSSGKSSVVKGLGLLCDYLSSLKQDKENGKKVVIADHELDFGKKPNNLLGKLSKVVNRKSSNNTVTFVLRVHSLMLTQDVDIEFCFSVEDGTNDGVISSVSICKLDGTMIFKSSKDKSCEGNLYSILPEFCRFVKAQACIAEILSIEGDRMKDWEENTMSDEEYNKFTEELNNFFSEFKNKYGSEVLKDINKWNNLHHRYRSFIAKYSSNPSCVLSKLNETGILYYLPILEAKFNGTKEESIAYLQEYIDSEKDEALVVILKKIRTAFIESPSKDFISFFKGMETEYLSHFTVEEGTPHLFNACTATIRGHQITVGMHSEKSVVFSCDGRQYRRKTEKELEEHNRKWIERPLDFPCTFEALAILSDQCKDETFYHSPKEVYEMDYTSNTEWLFFKFIETAIQEIAVEGTPDAISYIGSSLTNVKRLYPMESDDEFSGILKRYMKAKRSIDERMEYIPGSFLNRWIGKEHFDIGQRISIDIDEEGLGATLRLHENEEDSAGALLADSGYGITQLFAILLSIEVAIMERNAISVIPDNKISLFVDSKISFMPTTIAIEEPEKHLHPNFQAMLAEMFAEAYRKYGIHFMIETHSEYLIRKLQTLVLPKAKENQIDRKNISIIYINNADVSKRKFGDPHVMQIGIRANGTLDKNFGSGFFDQSLMSIRELQNWEE